MTLPDLRGFEIISKFPDPIENIETDCVQFGISSTPIETVSTKFHGVTDFLHFLVDAIDGFKLRANPDKQARAQELIDWLLPEKNLPPAILILLSSQRITSPPREYLRFGRNPIIPLLYCYETFPENSLRLRLMKRTVTMEPTLASILGNTPAALFCQSQYVYQMAYAIDVDHDNPRMLRQYEISKRAPDIYAPALVHSAPDPDYLPLSLEQLIDRYQRTIEEQNLQAYRKHKQAMDLIEQ